MKILLKDITEDGTQLQGDISTEDYDLPVDEYLGWKTIHYDFYVQKLGSECLISGVLTSQAQASCARCLEALPLHLRVDPFQHSYEISSGGESIDLTQQIREDILLSLPLAPKCQLDENQRCPFTGEVHQNRSDEAFDQLKRESAWDALEDLENLKHKDKE